MLNVNVHLYSPSSRLQVKPTRTRYLIFFLVAVIFQSILSLLVITMMHLNNTWTKYRQDIFSSWDTHAYHNIALRGYRNYGEDINLIVFYPLYPLAIRAMLVFIPSVVYAALAVTAASSILSHFLFLILLDTIKISPKDRVFSSLLFFLSPINIYFFAAYTEALYLYLTLAFFLLLLRRRYLPAALVGFLASLTRNVGVLLVLPFLYQTFVDKGINTARHLFKASLILLGLMAYLGINVLVFGDAFYFSNIMDTTWNKHPVNPIKTAVTLYKEFPLNFLRGGADPTIRVDIATVSLVPILLILHVIYEKRDLPLSWVLWVLANWFVVASQSYLLSSGRYLLILFPLYIYISVLFPKQKIFYPLMLILAVFFGYLSWLGIDLYTKGAWVY